FSGINDNSVSFSSPSYASSTSLFSTTPTSSFAAKNNILSKSAVNRTYGRPEHGKNSTSNTMMSSQMAGTFIKQTGQGNDHNQNQQNSLAIPVFNNQTKLLSTTASSPSSL